jgi:hypothetical protein
MSVFCLNEAWYFPHSFCSRNISNRILVSLGGKTAITSLRIIRLVSFIFYNPNSEFTRYLHIQTWLEIRSLSMIDSSKIWAFWICKNVLLNAGILIGVNQQVCVAVKIQTCILEISFKSQPVCWLPMVVLRFCRDNSKLISHVTFTKSQIFTYSLFINFSFPFTAKLYRSKQLAVEIQWPEILSTNAWMDGRWFN